MNYKQIPEELRELPNWVVWRLENGGLTSPIVPLVGIDYLF